MDLMTAEQAQAILENAAKSNRWGAAVQTIVVTLCKNNEMLRATLMQVARGAHALAREVAQLRGDAPEPAQTAGAPAVAGEPDTGLNAGGEPRSPEQQAIEDQMNAAIAVAEKPAASTTAQPRRARPRAVPAPTGGRVSGQTAANPDNLPVNSEERQAEVERLMDAADGK